MACGGPETPGAPLDSSDGEEYKTDGRPRRSAGILHTYLQQVNPGGQLSTTVTHWLPHLSGMRGSGKGE